MATYYLTGNQLYYGGSVYDPSAYYFKSKATIVVTDYPDRIEGYVDTYVGAWYNSSGSLYDTASFYLTVAGTQYSDSKTFSWSTPNQETNATALSRKTFTIYKTHSAQTLSVSISYYSRYFSSPSSASTSIAIPAKTNYVVTLKGNGATGWSDWTMTKWYNENLVLAPTTPPRLAGYNLNGWTSTVAKASAGQIDYAVNGTYTTNAGATFYAVWELAYTKPAITAYSIERCKANGDLDDEGGYAKVTLDWEIYKTNLPRFHGGSTYPYQNNSAECQIQVGTFSQTVTSTDASGTFSVILGDGSFSTDNQYSASITLTDTQTIKTDHSVTIAGALSTSFFPMDFNSTGTALGIFMPAPDTDEGVYLGKDLLLPLDTNVGSGTDHDIMVALTSLGWTDVIV